MAEARHDRQSFLGAELPRILDHARIGIVGLSGGGSHVVQQLAHVGFRKYVICDPDIIDATNVHRLIGARLTDVQQRTSKVEIARRLILGLKPDAEICAIQDRWQNHPEPLRQCDIVFGCVDTFKTRAELEVMGRRYLIPYIDIGMDVIQLAGQAPRMAGQVVLSMPGGPCMFCMRYLNEQLLTQEASRYGDVGGRPQVVWANGVMASTAIGMALDQLTAWSGSAEPSRFLSFDGNAGTLRPDPRSLHSVAKSCPHFSASSVGDPRPISL